MDDSVKKLLNNAIFIAELAALMPGEVAANLAKTALAYRNILAGLGVKMSPDHLTEFSEAGGCEQAQKLIRWYQGKEKSDPMLMLAWTSEILDAIDDLAHGKLP